MDMTDLLALTCATQRSPRRRALSAPIRATGRRVILWLFYGVRMKRGG